MNIYEAAKIAVKINGKIYRRCEGFQFVRIEPTDTPDCCRISHTREINFGRRWQPSAKDLIAEDWTVEQ